MKRDILCTYWHPVFEPMIYYSKYDCKVELYHNPYVNITCDPPKCRLTQKQSWTIIELIDTDY